METTYVDEYGDVRPSNWRSDAICDTHKAFANRCDCPQVRTVYATSGDGSRSRSMAV